jgi:hypothetical protein
MWNNFQFKHVINLLKYIQTPFNYEQTAVLQATDIYSKERWPNIIRQHAKYSFAQEGALLSSLELYVYSQKPTSITSLPNMK